MQNTEIDAGAININVDIILALEGPRESERDKNTDLFVLGRLLPTALERQK